MLVVCLFCCIICFADMDVDLTMPCSQNNLLVTNVSKTFAIINIHSITSSDLTEMDLIQNDF